MSGLFFMRLDESRQFLRDGDRAVTDIIWDIICQSSEPERFIFPMCCFVLKQECVKDNCMGSKIEANLCDKLWEGRRNV